jgi:hypothetical protein
VEEHFPEPLGNLADGEEEAEELAAEAADLTDQIDEELESEAPSVDDFDWPDPDEGFEDPLFDSTREYVEQIDRYKNHQGKRTTRKELERTYSTRKCVVCKKPFEANRSEAKYCSTICYRKSHAHAKNAKLRSELRKQRIAEGFGMRCYPAAQ